MSSLSSITRSPGEVEGDLRTEPPVKRRAGAEISHLQGDFPQESGKVP